jgi:hypothetical protein
MPSALWVMGVTLLPGAGPAAPGKIMVESADFAPELFKSCNLWGVLPFI